MTSPHWAEVRFLVPPLSKWSAISSDMKVFKSTSWSPFLLRLAFDPLLTCVGEPGVLERTLILAIAPLRPRKKKKGFRVARLFNPLESNPTLLSTSSQCQRMSAYFPCKGVTGQQFFPGRTNHLALTQEMFTGNTTNIYNIGYYQLLEAYAAGTMLGVQLHYEILPSTLLGTDYR